MKKNVSPYWNQGRAKLFVGDARDILLSFEEESIDTCITSPPYFNLRNYENEKQIGQESTPEAFVQELVITFRYIRRVLKDNGTLWINIADTYMTSSKKNAETDSKYKIKDLIGIPWMLAFALRDDGWYLRQDIIWHKVNARPQNLKDRCDCDHEYLFLLSKNKKYHFDFESIQVESASAGRVPGGNRKNDASRKDANRDMTVPVKNRRNRRSVWPVATKGIRDGHFAVFPQELIEPCILSSSPKNGSVLDPFAGSGTTLLSAVHHGRRGVGIELNQEYADIAVSRLKAQQMQAQDIFE